MAPRKDANSSDKSQQKGGGSFWNRLMFGSQEDANAANAAAAATTGVASDDDENSQQAPESTGSATGSNARGRNNRQSSEARRAAIPTRERAVRTAQSDAAVQHQRTSIKGPPSRSAASKGPAAPAVEPDADTDEEDEDESLPSASAVLNPGVSGFCLIVMLFTSTDAHHNRSQRRGRPRLLYLLYRLLPPLRRAAVKAKARASRNCSNPFLRPLKKRRRKRWNKMNQSRHH